jgi:hypothetical protein
MLLADRKQGETHREYQSVGSYCAGSLYCGSPGTDDGHNMVLPLYVYLTSRVSREQLLIESLSIN